MPRPKSRPREIYVTVVRNSILCQALWLCQATSPTGPHVHEKKDIYRIVEVKKMNDTVVSQDLQDSFVLLCVRDTEFLKQARTRLSSNLFSSEITRGLIDLCYDYYDQYHEAPKGHFSTECLRLLDGKNDDKTTLYMAYFDKISKMDPPNKEYVIDQIDNFVMARHIEKNTIRVVQLAKQGKFDECRALMQETLDAGIQVGGRKSIAPGSDGTPKVIRLSEVPSEEVKWLWPDIVPMGKLTLIIGDPGLGKSMLTMYMASHVTTGQPWPGDGQTPTGSVVLLTAEDGLSDTVRPRIDATGGDSSRMVAIQGVMRAGQDECFDLSKHIPQLEQVLQQTPDAKLLIVDPIAAYFGHTDSHVNTAVRRVLAPLADLADRYKIAVVAVNHLNKGTSSNAIHRAMGSIGFVGAARSVWLVCEDPEDGDRRLFLPAKSNLSSRKTGLAFHFVRNRIDFENSQVDVTAEEALQAVQDRREKKPVEKAMEWLRNLLKDGAMRSAAVMDMAKAEGFSESVINRAATKLGVVHGKVGNGERAYWVFMLPPVGGTETSLPRSSSPLNLDPMSRQSVSQ